MLKKYLTVSIIIFMAVISNAQLFQEYPYLSSPDDIMKIAMDSKISYSFNAISSSSVNVKYPILTAVYMKCENDENPILEVIKSEEAKELSRSAGVKIDDEEYDAAIPFLLKAIELENNSSILLTQLGRCYSGKEDYTKAKEIFKKALELNYYNYQTHLYLSEAYAKEELYKDAFRSIITAHILNRNDSDIRDLMIDYLEESGDDWKEFEIKPIYNLNKDESTGVIKIDISKDWLIYAAAVALYRYEPGYAEKKLGKDYSPMYAKYAQEACGFIASILKPELKQYVYVLKDKTLEPFTYYELLLPREPLVAYTLSKETIELIKNIIIRYH